MSGSYTQDISLQEMCTSVAIIVEVACDIEHKSFEVIANLGFKEVLRRGETIQVLPILQKPSCDHKWQIEPHYRPSHSLNELSHAILFLHQKGRDFHWAYEEAYEDISLKKTVVTTVREHFFKPFQHKKLTLFLPNHYKIVHDNKELVSSVIPEQTPTVEHFFHYQGQENEDLFVFYWEGREKRDRGPISIASQATVKRYDRSVELLTTEIFMGKEKKVYVAYLSLGDEDSFMIYSDHSDYERFERILQRMDLED